jgi:hypothetical protein
MADTNPARAISQVKRVAMMCDFIEHPAIKTAVEQAVPVSMPPDVGALGDAHLRATGKRPRYIGGFQADVRGHEPRHLGQWPQAGYR